MVVVSNTSPISNLAIIGRLELLVSQFLAVVIPAAVESELQRMSDPFAKAAIDDAFRQGWLSRQIVRNRPFVSTLATDLDIGEAEAIALAAELRADLLLIDEKDGRRFARQAGVAVVGVLGVLMQAKARGDIALVKPEIDALRHRAGFYVAASLEASVLRDSGE